MKGEEEVRDEEEVSDDEEFTGSVDGVEGGDDEAGFRGSKEGHGILGTGGGGLFPGPPFLQLPVGHNYCQYLPRLRPQS